MTHNMILAIDLCTKLYPLMRESGMFPALTGGTLYKDGMRKDIDLVVYPQDSCEEIDPEVLETLMQDVGCTPIAHFGRVSKFTYRGVDIDVIMPTNAGEYYG